eukprot:TRINITY_DN3861_c0_g1_i1.p1 TRINITY_DN3861_c0_g1~~TRINITY_DN3861_c0_g1_i1.p1  ORF type:complete len:331 (+),score=51.30 TRINITY_DN3861_c0_g1_i1:70-993(+)
MDQACLPLVLEWLGVRDVAGAARVCRAWARACESDALWQSLVHRDFNAFELLSCDTAVNCHWREIYRFVSTRPCVGDLVEVNASADNWCVARVLLRLNATHILVFLSRAGQRMFYVWLDLARDSEFIRPLQESSVVSSFNTTRMRMLQWFMHAQRLALLYISSAVPGLDASRTEPVPCTCLPLLTEFAPGETEICKFSLYKPLLGKKNVGDNSVLTLAKPLLLESIWKSLQQISSYFCSSHSVLVDPRANQLLKVQDTVNKWYGAYILQVDESHNKIQVHYDGWGTLWVRTIPGEQSVQTSRNRTSG